MSGDTPLHAVDRIVIFDVESTGIERDEVRIVQWNASLMGRDGNLIGQAKTRIINPGVPIPEGAANVHGITDEIAAEIGGPPEESIQELADLLNGRIARGTPIVAYNAPYDLTVLDRESRRHLGTPFPLQPEHMIVIDPLVIDKKIDKWRAGSRKLIDTAAHYGIDLVGAHDAEADAIAAGRVCFALFDRMDPNMTLRQLHDAQIEWARSGAYEFQLYKRGPKNKKGPEPDAVIDPRWPMAPFGDVLDPNWTDYEKVA